MIDGTLTSISNSVRTHPDLQSRANTRHAGHFLKDNYLQALDIIKINSASLETFQRIYSITDEDFKTWRLEEIEFLDKAHHAPAEDDRAVAYIEALENLTMRE